MNTAGQADKGPHIKGPSKSRSVSADYSSVTATFKPVQGLGPISSSGATQKVNYGQSTHK